MDPRSPRAGPKEEIVQTLSQKGIWVSQLTNWTLDALIDKKLTPTINRLNSRVFNFNSSTSISNQLVKIVSLHVEFSLARVIHYLEAAKVDGRSDDEGNDVGRRIVAPQ